MQKQPDGYTLEECEMCAPHREAIIKTKLKFRPSLSLYSLAGDNKMPITSPADKDCQDSGSRTSLFLVSMGATLFDWRVKNLSDFVALCCVEF